MGGMRDRRFKKTEESILAVFFDARNDTMVHIAKKAGIARSTIYKHHHSAAGILPDWEKYILEEYNMVIQNKKIKNPKALYFEMLMFILRNKNFFEVFLKFEDREIIMKMIYSMRAFEGSEKIFKIYVGEATELIFDWCERGFSEEELGKVLSDAVYLTQTAWSRLSPIL